MKVALVGATGFVGSAVLEELVSRGHQVTALARKIENINPSGNVVARSIDVYDTAALTEALKGNELVINTYNAGWDNPNIYDDFLKGSRSIQEATKQAGISRLIAIGGAGSLYGSDGKQLVDGPDFPKPYLSGAQAARDYLDELKKETDLDWVFLSPPIEFNLAGPTERRGTYRVGKDEPLFDESGHSIISAPDLAMAIVDEAEQPRHHKERFTIGY